ncbi:hypothetical protein [Streptomyces sp. NPDC008001]|uniref:hypothetical protein n=1 Tax=Streptomyces sp. NPDC008001 TaxID=3364804 RepID=UPI0036EF12DB
MTSTTERHRPAAAAVLLLLLAVLFGPVPGGAQPSAAAVPPVRATESVSTTQPARATEPVRATEPARHADPAAAHTGEPVRADAPDPGSSCRQQDVPLKDAETAVPSAHTDPVTAPGTARAPLPQAPAPRATAPRAPPASVAGCAELLPVLRI